MSTFSVTRDSFERLVSAKGADVLWHRELGGVPCPCLTPEGFRDPEWHIAHPTAPVCNDNGMLPATIQEGLVKGFVQPAFFGTRSRATQFLMEAFGELQTDDHIGIFPLVSNGITIDFRDWSDGGSDWVEFNDLRFLAITWNLIPAPDNANANHHWECALRRINQDR